ncbi:glycosyltransferase [Aquabacterium sp. A3]|uniref:glycosyltransferase family 2 protein n=1 Tax=Aquabacterium sp. A3 TaxID=3132829 RepID=UPI00311A2645
MLPNISFLIPVYNVQSFLDDCLASVVTACANTDQIILINDGSTDESGSVCDKWAARYPDLIQVVHQPNQGLSVARNVAYAHCHGDYVCFIDSDDVLCSEAIAVARQHLRERQPDILTMDAILWRSGEHDEPLRHSLPALQTVSAQHALIAAFRDNFMSSCCRIFRRSLLESMAPQIFPPGRCYEDNITVPLLIAKASTIMYVPHALFRYRVRPGSITRHQTFSRCMDQATSLASPLRAIKMLNESQELEQQANVAVLSNVVIAIRHAGAIPRVSRADLEALLAAGLSSLTMNTPALLAAAQQADTRHAKLSKHARGMLLHPKRYVLARWLMARWKQMRQPTLRT